MYILCQENQFSVLPLYPPSQWSTHCLSACLCLSVSLSACLYLSVFLYLSLNICLSACLSVCLSICLSIYMYVCVPYVQSLASQDPARAVEQVEELLLGHQISSTDALQVLLLILEQENETSIQMEVCVQHAYVCVYVCICVYVRTYICTYVMYAFICVCHVCICLCTTILIVVWLVSNNSIKQSKPVHWPTSCLYCNPSQHLAK